MCKPPPESTTCAAQSAMPNNLVANGAPPYNQSKKNKRCFDVWSTMSEIFAYSNALKTTAINQFKADIR